MNTYEEAKDKVKQLTTEEAIQFGEKEMWRDLTHIGIFRFQILQDKLCMDFSTFQEATEKTLGRGVWTHEFAKPELLWNEYLGNRTTSTDPFSTWDEVINEVQK
jgi:hypothetical protein